MGLQLMEFPLIFPIKHATKEGSGEEYSER